MPTGERISHEGAAPETSLDGAINASTASIVVVAGTGYPDGSVGSFWIVVDPGLAAEEKIKCVSRTGNTITAVTTPSTGRGGDGTAAISHVSGAVVQHILSADEVDKLNAHIADLNDNHQSLLNTTRHDVTARHPLGTVVPAGTPGSSGVADVAAAGVSTSGARADHVHAREGWGASITTSAVGDAASTGNNSQSSRSDHTHGREAFGSPAAIGTGISTGSAATVNHSDHVHSAPQHVRVVGRTSGSLVGGTPPAAGTGPWLEQWGTQNVTVAGAGQEAEATVTLPVAFSTGIVAVEIMNANGDVGANLIWSGKTYTTSSFKAHCYAADSGTPNGQTYAITWVAKGW